MHAWFPRPWVFVLLALFAVSIGCDKGPAGGKGTGASSKDSGAASVKRVILLTNGADPFWDAMNVGMQNAEKDFDLASVGLRTVMERNNGTATGQVEKLKQYANQTDIAAVAISVTDSANNAIAKAMADLRGQGVHVIAIDSDVSRENAVKSRFAYLGTNNTVGGQELGKAAKGIRPDGGKYATFVGIKAAANAKERIAGFGEGAGEKFIKTEDLGDNMDTAVALKNVKDALSRNPDLGVLVGIWAYNAHAIVEVVKEQGIRDKITVVVFDAAPKAIGHMEDGNIDAMVVQNPYDMGYRGTRLIKALVTEDQETIKEMFPSWDPEAKKFTEPDGDLLTTGLKVVYPDEGSPLAKDMFAPTTEFVKFSDFKKWLADHGLTGS